MKRNWLKTELILCFICFVFLAATQGCFAQDDGNDDSNGSSNGEGTSEEVSASPNNPEANMGRKGSNLIKDFKAAAAENAKNAESLAATEDDSQNPEAQDNYTNQQRKKLQQEAQVQALAAKKQEGANLVKREVASDLNQAKYSEAIKVSLAPLQKMSEQELSNLILETTKNSKMHEYFQHYPKLMFFSVRLIKDQNALPSLAKVAEDRERLVRFSVMMLTTFVFAFLLKRILKKDGRSILEAISLWLFRLVLVLGIRCTIIFFVFNAELTPTIKIASKTFF